MPRTARPVRLKDHWRIRWLDHAGKRQSAVFDSYREADHELRRRQAEVEDIKRGLRAAPPPEKKTVGEALDYWLENRAPQKRSGDHDESIIRSHLRPAFGRLLLRELGVQHVDLFVAQRAKLDPKTVHNHLTLLISVLNAALDLGWLVKLPRIKKPKVRTFSTDYRYLRTEAERDMFLRAAHAEGEFVFALYATAVFTGMRAPNVFRKDRATFPTSGRYNGMTTGPARLHAAACPPSSRAVDAGRACCCMNCDPPSIEERDRAAGRELLIMLARPVHQRLVGHRGCSAEFLSVTADGENGSVIVGTYFVDHAGVVYWRSDGKVSVITRIDSSPAAARPES